MFPPVPVTDIAGEYVFSLTHLILNNLGYWEKNEPWKASKLLNHSDSYGSPTAGKVLQDLNLTVLTRHISTVGHSGRADQNLYVPKYYLHMEKDISF